MPTRKFRWSKDGGVNYADLDVTLPYVLPVTVADNVLVEPIGAAVSVAGEFTTGALALFARMTTPPSDTRRTLINGVFAAGERDGWLAKLDALYLLAANDSQAAKLNWISSSYNLTETAAPAFTADKGFVGNGTSQRLDTTFNPTTASAPKFVQNSNHLGIWSLADLANAGGQSNDAGSDNSRMGRPASSTDGRMNGRPGSTGTLGPMIVGAYPGHSMYSRTGSATWRGYAQGEDVAGGVDASAAAQNATLKLLFTDGVGYGVNPLAAAHFGAALTAAEVVSLRNALTTYLTGISTIKRPCVGWGDSLTIGGQGGATGRYPYLLARIPTPNRVVVNKGVAGNTSTQVKDRMLLDTTYKADTHLLWAGRNNINSFAIKFDMNAMVQALPHSRYLIGEITPSAADDSPTKDLIVSINNELAAIYGSRFVRFMSALQAANDGSANDLADVAAGLIPRSLRTDDLHLNTAGQTIIANLWQNALVGMGW